MGNPKKRKMPRTQGEKKENRGIKNESNGEIDIGMFKLGRASEWVDRIRESSNPM